METSTMIRQLRRTAKKHENDKLHTFDTDISLMCTEVANRLEELEKENKEIRAKTIDEFAEKCYEKISKCECTLSGLAITAIADELKWGAK